MSRRAADLRASWLDLDRRLSGLLADLPDLTPSSADDIRRFIDHNEFGLALERLVEGIVDLGLSLRDDQRLELANLAKTMQMRAPLFG